jgi:Txe/YoeB family toxin of Txe-Axe toxin-antitoxin module
MNKPVRVILLDEADSEYKKLNEIIGQQITEGKENTEEIQLLRSIKQKIEFIKSNPFYGDNISKSLIPKEYIIKYNAKNLWRAELTNYWRMLYTIKGDQIEIICFILDILNHKNYDKKFGYRKK